MIEKTEDDIQYHGKSDEVEVYGNQDGLELFKQVDGIDKLTETVEAFKAKIADMETIVARVPLTEADNVTMKAETADLKQKYYQDPMSQGYRRIRKRCFANFKN